MKEESTQVGEMLIVQGLKVTCKSRLKNRFLRKKSLIFEMFIYADSFNWWGAIRSRCWSWRNQVWRNRNWWNSRRYRRYWKSTDAAFSLDHYLTWTRGRECKQNIQIKVNYHMIPAIESFLYRIVAMISNQRTINCWEEQLLFSSLTKFNPLLPFYRRLSAHSELLCLLLFTRLPMMNLRVAKDKELVNIVVAAIITRRKPFLLLTDF